MRIQIPEVGHLAQNTRMMLLDFGYGSSSVEIISDALNLNIQRWGRGGDLSQGS